MSSLLASRAAHEAFSQTMRALIKASTRHSHISCLAKQHRSWALTLKSAHGDPLLSRDAADLSVYGPCPQRMALRAGSLLGLQSAATSSPSRSKNNPETEAIVTGRNARSKGLRREPFRLVWTHQHTLIPKISLFPPSTYFLFGQKSTCDDASDVAAPIRSG